MFARVALCWGILHLIILTSYSSLPHPDSGSTDLFRSGPLDLASSNDTYLQDVKMKQSDSHISSERHLLDSLGRPTSHQKTSGISLGAFPKFKTITEGAPTCNNVDPEDISFTLVTQLSDERLWMMRHHCAGWKSEISLAVLTNRDKDSVEKELVGLRCQRFAVNVLAKDDFKSGDYPVNVLRNLAISSVKTSHFLYVDADFWLSHHTDRVLMKKDVRHVLSNDPKQAIVLPAYQLRHKCRNKKDPTACRNEKIPQMPQTKLHLLEGMNGGNVTVFDPKNPHGKYL